MNMNNLIEKLRKHPEAHRVGMIACHLGIVRGTSRDGREVTGIDVAYDHTLLESIISDIKKMDGIVDVAVDTREGHLTIGDEVLAVAVAGDIREHVFSALMAAVNRIKAEASKKKEYFREG